MNRAVFLDRDGVLVEDVHLLQAADQLRLLPGVSAALLALDRAGLRLVVVTNQTVVARGLIGEGAVEAIHGELNRLLLAAGAPPIASFYYCPHHPRATLPAYRMECDCRKPRPGMLVRAARDHGLDLGASFMVGDRPTDIMAGALAGCRTVLVQSGRHADPLIEMPDGMEVTVEPDGTCADLEAAARWILLRT
jgi:D-glycero-D-manno-heptose 1,7-bisphosphate phosphatase